MKKIIGLALTGLLTLLFSAACTVEAGVGGDTSGTCADTSCQSALIGGLATGDTMLCSGPADDAYQAVLDCACGTGSACVSVCGDNLCQYGPESPDCGDCLDQTCTPEHDTCANN